MSNIILNTDSYKPSHAFQFDKNLVESVYYVEPRWGNTGKVVMGPFRPFLMEYLSKPITWEDVEEAEDVLTAHGEPFYMDGWKDVLKHYGGYLPVTIMAVPEGTRTPIGIPQVVVSSEPGFEWLPGYLETAILRAVWYGSTVATISYNIKRVIKKYLEKTGDVAGLPFKLHDFGSRGVSSKESAGIGGLAHLFNFMGTDTIEAVMYARKYYSEKMAAFSIPASEHSTVMSWGKDREEDFQRNMIKEFGGKYPLFASVQDTNDVYAAAEMWGTKLKEELIDSGSILVFRPDSGDPVTVVMKLLHNLASNFGTITNSKGYMVLNNVRMIQGDGVNPTSIEAILSAMERAGFSADNIAFGMGGALLQRLDRDTFGYAMKLCAGGYMSHGEVIYRGLSKNPITDTNKASKAGWLAPYTNGTDWMVVDNLDDKAVFQAVGKGFYNALVPVYKNGEILNGESLSTIRDRLN